MTNEFMFCSNRRFISSQCCHIADFLGKKYVLKTHFCSLNVAQNIFVVTHWANPMLERTKEPLEIVVQLKDAQNAYFKICHLAKLNPLPLQIASV